MRVGVLTVGLVVLALGCGSGKTSPVRSSVAPGRATNDLVSRGSAIKDRRTEWT